MAKYARFRTKSGAVFAGSVADGFCQPLLSGDGLNGRMAVVDLAMGDSTRIQGPAPVALQDVEILPPIPEPGTIRDFYAFEQHVKTANRLRGREVPEEWYEAPVFYFTNPYTVVGTGASVRPPEDSKQVDYELELACIVGRDCASVSVDDAASVIAGYTIMNDFSARDIQRQEMKVGLGPAKGKDFATAIGPWLVTPDELPGADSGRPALEMTALVNGEVLSRGRSQDIHFSFFELVAQASKDSKLRRGDVIGSGTVGTGCILERSLADPNVAWLKDGDVVTLSIEVIGELTNSILR